MLPRHLIIFVEVLVWSVQASASDKTDFTYDALGRLIAVRRVSPDGNLATDYSFDKAGNRTNVNVTAPSGGIVVATPDQANTLLPSVSIDPTANDATTNGTALTVTSLGTPTNGAMAQVDGTGRSVSISQISGYGTSVSYTVRDTRGASASSTISITTKPVIVNDVASVASNTNSSNNSVLVMALSNDSSFASSTMLIGGRVDGSKGSTAVKSGGVVYTPRPGFFGADIFTYFMRDSIGNTGSGNVNITITGQNHSPVPVTDNINTTAGVNITFDPRANDSDPDGGELRIVSTSSPGHGSIAFSGTSITYRPNTGYVGSDSFLYRVRDVNDDQAYSAVSTVNVTIAP